MEQAKLCIDCKHFKKENSATKGNQGYIYTIYGDCKLTDRNKTGIDTCEKFRRK